MMKKHHGMTFIEILIALFILVTGILGAVATQQASKKGSFDAMQRSLASSLAQDIIERIRSNSADAAVLETYEGDYGNGTISLPANRCNNAALPCSTALIRDNDLFEWEQALMGSNALLGGNKNVGGLTNATGCIVHTNQVVTVTISWQGRQNTTDGARVSCGGAAADKSRRQVTMTTFLF